ncbi:MAG: hypothetical protein HY675_05830 [Chloroflexi bacterium]|nr:hypothetical protein [Chloroflexota bacterium]
MTSRGACEGPLTGLPVPGLIFGGVRNFGQIIAEQTTYTVTATVGYSAYLPVILR